MKDNPKALPIQAVSAETMGALRLLAQDRFMKAATLVWGRARRATDTAPQDAWVSLEDIPQGIVEGLEGAAVLEDRDESPIRRLGGG